MKQQVVSRTHTTITLDRLPTDVQMGDRVQIVSSTGKVRGKTRISTLMEYSPLLPLAMFFTWWALNMDNIRYKWLLGLSIVLLFLSVMAMMVAMEKK